MARDFMFDLLVPNRPLPTRARRAAGLGSPFALAGSSP